MAERASPPVGAPLLRRQRLAWDHDRCHGVASGLDLAILRLLLEYCFMVTDIGEITNVASFEVTVTHF